MSVYRRFSQVRKFGWQHAKKICADNHQYCVIWVFLDILYCYFRYKMWSNQYVKEQMYLLHGTARLQVGWKCLKENSQRESWVKDFYETRKFLSKWSRFSIEKSAKKRALRNKAYEKRFSTGKNLMVEYNVTLTRQHHLNGSITIGSNVLLAKNVFIDYSGNITIKDNVQITNDVIIESHHHAFHSNYKISRDVISPTRLVIEEGAVIGSRAIILASCNYIGKHARVGAGAVVTHDIPDYAVAVGVPARVVREMPH